MKNSRTPGGFILIEMIVALVVGGIAVLAAAALFNGLTTQAAAVRRLAADNDARFNGERLVRNLLENLEFRTSTAPALVGDATNVRLKTWCDDVDGWLVPCSARITLRREASSVALDLELTATDQPAQPLSRPVELRRGQRGELRYLVDPAHGGTWAASWNNRVPPVAVAIIIDKDTVFVGVGGNG